MSNKAVGTIGAAVSGILALLWLITITVSWNWLWSENGVVFFNVNLWTVVIKPGTLGMGAQLLGWFKDQAFGGEAGERAMEDLFNHNYWMGDAVHHLCMTGVNSIWQWCDTWTMVQFGSIVEILMSFVVIIFLAMGGAFQYYYAHEHATHKGRMWIRSCYVVAPCCAWLGLMQYSLLTFQMGRGERRIVPTKANYGVGFVMACGLTLLTLVPLYIHGIFSKVDEFEKHGDNDMFSGYPTTEMAQMQAQPGGMPMNYPSSQPTSSAGPPPMGFGSYPQQAPPQATYSTSQAPTVTVYPTYSAPQAYSAGQAAYLGQPQPNW